MSHVAITTDKLICVDVWHGLNYEVRRVKEQLRQLLYLLMGN